MMQKLTVTGESIFTKEKYKNTNVKLYLENSRNTVNFIHVWQKNYRA